jgi:hypothetical protein
MADNKIIKDLNSTCDMKELILELINPECKEVASDLFHCLENKVKNFDFKGKLEDIESQLNQQDCFSNFNLDECLNKH